MELGKPEDCSVDPMLQWFEVIYKEAVELHHHLQMFEFTRDEILQKNPIVKNSDPTYLSWIMRSSSVDLVIRVCRLCDDDKRTESLVRFLRELMRKPEYLKRERYTKLYEGNVAESLAVDDFNSLAGGDYSDFPIQKIKEDIEQLLKAGPFSELRDFRNEYLVHLAKAKGDKPLNDALFYAIEKIGQIAKRYDQLLTGANVMGFTPTIQGDWQAILREPLISSQEGVK